MILFSEKVESIHTVMNWISQSQFGKNVLQEMQRSRYSDSISFNQFSPDVCSKLKMHSQVSAAFVTDGTYGDIYYDGSSQLGMLIPVIFHEIIHSMDERLWKLAKYPDLLASQKRDILFQSEIRAYHGQIVLLRELWSDYPQLKQFLEIEFPYLPHFQRDLTPGEIAELYGDSRRSAVE
jgi:hypothetical protein